MPRAAPVIATTLSFTAMRLPSSLVSRSPVYHRGYDAKTACNEGRPDMAETTVAQASPQVSWNITSAYDQWVESLGLPIHRGYFVQDPRTGEVGWWEGRQGNGAFLLHACPGGGWG